MDSEDDGEDDDNGNDGMNDLGKAMADVRLASPVGTPHKSIPSARCSTCGASYK